ncbi:hypothetical protein SG34_025040 [Thalassomonas viridans]|uniref:Uncharacterized protein n=1 Tax=Thalassomonas viridans TaxID=137584 RepID=A0AAF0C8N5_9GAMM|nr:hypothetical protein [Thalassomonas viridans]WDE04561.1 hypothetical protein SG34_025040 [Thalassomonas viridans]
MFCGLALSPRLYSVTIITHSSVGQADIPTTQLRRIFSMRQLRWQNGIAITVFVLPSQHPLHQRFSKEKLGIFPYQLDSIWQKLSFSGLGTTPIVVQTPEDLLEAVLATPGAIGYAEGSMKTGAAINVH